MKKTPPARALIPVLSSFATSVARPGYWIALQVLACLTARSDRSAHSMFQLRHLGRSTWLLDPTADARLRDRSV